MFRLVIAVPATSHPSERAAARVRERGWVSVNAPATDTLGIVCSGVHTRPTPRGGVGVPSTRTRPRASLLFHVAVLSTYLDVWNGRALGLCQRDRQSGWNRRLRSGDVFPDNVKSSNARDSYGIPAAEAGDGYRKAGRMNDSPVRSLRRTEDRV